MNPQRERAREHFPSVLLGVLGIIQALALELVWERGVGGIGRWQALGAGGAGWLQVLAMFQGVVVVWLMYASLVLRHSWVPHFSDLVFPFVLGGLEFLLVEWMAPERIAGFFVVLAVVFVVSASMTFWVYQTMAAAGDLAARPRREQLASYVPSGVATGVLVLSAIATALSGPGSGVATVCLLLANLGLTAQILSFRHYWKADMAEA